MTEPGIAPSYALGVSCTEAWGSWGEDFRAAGAYFRNRLARSIAGFFFGYGQPVTAFVVRSIDASSSDPNDGCSNGPLSNYVTVVAVREAICGQYSAEDDVSVLSYWVDSINLRILAHETAHACGLVWHTSGFDNLMTQDSEGGVGTELSRFHRVIFRSSRHVTYL